MKVCKENKNNWVENLKNYQSRDSVILNCFGCNQEISKTKHRIQAAIKNELNLYCNNVCAATQKTIRVETCCAFCFKKVYRVKSQVSEYNFCNNSCSASFFNARRDKLPLNVCKCGKQIQRRSLKCFKCDTKDKKLEGLNFVFSYTLQDVINKSNNKSNAYQRLNAWARKYSTVLGLTEKSCKLCGYNKYVELCHIKSMSKFSLNSLVSEINSKENLVYLCPNHHKELDLGFLKPKQIEKLNLEKH